MKGNKETDWTEALRDKLGDFEVAPSDGGWERLAAGGKRAAATWWPYAAALAACLAACALWLFSPDASQPAAENILAEVPAVEPVSEEPAAAAPDTVVVRGISAETAVAAASVASAAPVTPVASGQAEPVALIPAAPFAEENRIAVAGPAPSHTADVTQEAPDAPSELPAEEIPTHGEVSVAPSSSIVQDEPAGVLCSAPVRPRGRVSISLSAGSGSGASQGGIPSANGSKMKKAARRYDISELLRHEAPVHFSGLVDIPLTERLFIGSGLGFSSYKASFGEIRQEMVFSTVPLTFGYHAFRWNGADVAFSVGAAAEGCLSARLMDVDYDEDIQYRALAAASLRWKLFGPVNLFAQPELSYYFTRTTLPMYRSNHPLTFSATAGLSFQF